jgi:hypothetical protein
VLLGRAEGGDEFVESFGGYRVEKSVAICEVAQRGAVADASPLGESSKRDRLRALCRQQLTGLAQQNIAEGAVVVRSGHASSLAQCRR